MTRVTIVGAGNMGRGIGTRVVSDGGLRPIDAGPLRRGQQLEQVGFLHISLQQPLGLGFGSAIKLGTP
jgi:8-hydroxy-5-deazaflavin:NADPH oxidoreductase